MRERYNDKIKEDSALTHLSDQLLVLSEIDDRNLL